MSDFSSMHEAVHAAFAVPATVQRGAAAPISIDVVVDEGQVVVGEFGQAVGQVCVANFLVAQFRPKPGDVLTVGAVSRLVEKIRKDDGFIAEAVLHG